MKKHLNFHALFRVNFVLYVENRCYHVYVPFNPFYATSFFILPPNNIRKAAALLNVFSGHRKRPDV